MKNLKQRISMLMAVTIVGTAIFSPVSDAVTMEGNESSGQYIEYNEEIEAGEEVKEVEIEDIPEEGEEEEEKEIEVSEPNGMDYRTIKDLDLQSGNSNDFQSILKIEKGSFVKHLGTTSNGWFKVDYKGTIGYVYRGHVTTSNNYENNYSDIKVSKPNGMEYRNIKILNLRSGNSNSDRLLRVIPKGNFVKHLGTTDNGWFKLEYNGVIGYAYRGYVTAPNNYEKHYTDIKVSKPNGMEYRTIKNLHLRCGNSSNNRSIVVMPKGSFVKHLGTADNGWFKLEYKGHIGYAHRRDVTAPNNYDSYNNSVRKEDLYFITQNLSLRKGPSNSTGAILTIPSGTHLDYQGSSGKWYKVNYKGKVGYVDSSRVKKGSGYKSKGVLIVNKGYALSSSFNPGVNPEAQSAFNRMKVQAKKEGITLNIFSGFRTYSYQANLYNRYVKKDGKKAADTYSARAGHSEHQTGLSFDIGGKRPNLTSGFGKTKEGRWIENNAHKFGFILRYPKGKEHITGYIYEPWHIRYVGVEVSNQIKKNGLTLDEYLKAVKSNY